MFRRSIVVGFFMFVIGGMFWHVIYVWRTSLQRLDYTRNQHFEPSSNKNRPRVYVHNGDYLEHVPDFCRWTAQYDCAEMNTESGPMPVYIHSVTKKHWSVSTALLKEGTWEPHITKVLQEELNKYPDAGFIDIGCNIGPFTLQAANMGRHVVSADAVIDNILKVCKSVEKNNLTDRVVMVANPVYNEHVMVTLKSPTETYEFTSIVDNALNKNAKKPESVCSASTKSNTVLLDDLLPLMTFNTAIMKIDVESFEFYVISGGIKLFTEINIPAVIMEWMHVKKTKKATDLIGIMKKLDYLPYSVGQQESQALNLTTEMRWTHDVVWKKQLTSTT